MLNIKYFLIYFFVLISSYSFAQKKINERKNRDFEFYLEQYLNNVYATDSLALTLINLAQTNYQKSKAYSIYGGNKYISGNYIEAIKYYQKAKYFVTKTDSIGDHGDIMVGLMTSYRRAGFIVESNAYLDSIEKFSSKFPPAIKERGMMYTLMKVYDIDEDYCKAADVREKHLKLVEEESRNTERGNRYNFALWAQLNYVQIKCGMLEKAVLSMQKADAYLQRIKGIDPIMMKDFHMMNKALIYHNHNNNELSRVYFDSACMYVAKEKSIALQKVVYSERLEAKIDDVDETLFYLQKLKDISKKESTITKNMAADEAVRKQKLIQTKENDILMLTSGVILLLALGVLSLVLYRRKQRLLKVKYQKIIDDLQKSKDLVLFSEEKIKEDFLVKEETVLAVEKDFLLTPEKEKELLKNLESFERKKLYTTKSISASQMAVMLKTNTKYLSYLLKKFRGEDFYSYINTCRINFIVNELSQNPQLLQYKISVLSDMCGYNTHSQFGSNFKNIKGISPSEFIRFLIKDQKK